MNAGSVAYPSGPQSKWIRDSACGDLCWLLGVPKSLHSQLLPAEGDVQPLESYLFICLWFFDKVSPSLPRKPEWPQTIQPRLVSTLGVGGWGVRSSCFTLLGAGIINMEHGGSFKPDPANLPPSTRILLEPYLRLCFKVG